VATPERTASQRRADAFGQGRGLGHHRGGRRRRGGGGRHGPTVASPVGSSLHCGAVMVRLDSPAPDARHRMGRSGGARALRSGAWA
jgi:hypothetical protein